MLVALPWVSPTLTNLQHAAPRVRGRHPRTLEERSTPALHRAVRRRTKSRSSSEDVLLTGTTSAAQWIESRRDVVYADLRRNAMTATEPSVAAAITIAAMMRMVESSSTSEESSETVVRVGSPVVGSSVVTTGCVIST